MSGFLTSAIDAAGRQQDGSSWSERAHAKRYRFADLELDLGRRQVRRGDEPIKLTKLTFDLLAALVRRAPNLVRHEELAALAWGGGRVVTPESIAQRIMVLRRSLGDSAGAPCYIEGRRSEGYRLIPEVTSVDVKPISSPGGEANALLGLDSVPISDGKVPVPDNSARAQALYAQALTLWSSNENAGSIRTILNRVIGLDPGFAPAYGLLAYLDATSSVDTINAPAVDRRLMAELEQNARRNAAAGLALDSDLGPAYVALASLDMHNWHWEAARRGFDRGGSPGWANDIAPWFYCWTGDPESGIARAKHNLSRHPTSWIAHRDLGIVFAYAGNLARARQSLETAASMAPANTVTLAWLAYLAVREGPTAEARDRLAQVEALFEARMPIVLLPELACAYGRIGDVTRAADLFDEIGELEAERVLGCGTWAAAHIAVRDERGALAWLDRAAEKVARHEPDSGFMSLMNLKMNFLDDPLLRNRPFVLALNRLCGD